MKPLPYPAPLACTEPGLGARATQALGQALPAAIAAHITACPACRLQRVAFDSLDQGALPPSPDLHRRLRAAALDRFRR